MTSNQATIREVKCTHCGLPVPAGLVESERTQQFCCNGCASAWNLIHNCGLEAFYQMVDPDDGSRSLRSTRGMRDESERRTSANAYVEYDAPVFLEKYAKPAGSEQLAVELLIDGIHCGACVWLLEKLPAVLPGVVDAKVNWVKRSLVLRWYQSQVPLSEIARTLARLGYRPAPMIPGVHQTRWQSRNRQHLVGIGVAAACALNNMMVSAALYFGMYAHMTVGMSNLMRVASGVVGAVALIGPGRVFLKSAASAIAVRTPHMDLPIALGLTVGTVAGWFNVIRGTGEIYFDSLSVLVFLLLLGRWIQFRQQAKAADAIELLYRLTPQKTRRIVGGKTEEVLVDLVVADDRLHIFPGDLFPVDGEIVTGSTLVDESILTGESVPGNKSDGDPVMAGTQNLQSAVVIAARKIGQETRLGKIAKLVEDASLQKPAVVQWANRVGGYFVIGVTALASLTFIFWVKTDPAVAVDRAVALLIVACPCALALATPLAIAVALGRAAQQQIMVKGGDVLQALQTPGKIWLDKTGTLTEGQLRVVHWHGDTQSLPAIGALEKLFSHPVAAALVDFADHDEQYTVQYSQVYPGMGIRGVVRCPEGQGDRVEIYLGNQKLVQQEKFEISDAWLTIARQTVERCCSPCWVVVDGRVVAIAAMGDRIRGDAVRCLAYLRGRGWEIGILSGDQQAVVSQVASNLGIDAAEALGGMTPEEKLSVVSQAAAVGNVIMIGDGVNDSAALAAAPVGIAVQNGAEVSLAAAPVYLGRAGLEPLIKLFAISDSATVTMRTNLIVSLGYNLLFAALAFAGYINPLVAAILMPISSLTVVFLSLASGVTSGNYQSQPSTRLDDEKSAVPPTWELRE